MRLAVSSEAPDLVAQMSMLSTYGFFDEQATRRTLTQSKMGSLFSSLPLGPLTLIPIGRRT
jgi:hypothetical protein